MSWLTHVGASSAARSIGESPLAGHLRRSPAISKHDARPEPAAGTENLMAMSGNFSRTRLAVERVEPAVAACGSDDMQRMSCDEYHVEQYLHVCFDIN